MRRNHTTRTLPSPLYPPFPAVYAAPLQMDEVYEVSASVAREFNMQGNLEKGCTIAGFLRVGRAMMAHGAV